MNRPLAEEIRKKSRKGWTRGRLAKHYGVVDDTVRDILSGKRLAWDPCRVCIVCGANFYASHHHLKCCGPRCRKTRRSQHFNARLALQKATVNDHFREKPKINPKRPRDRDGPGKTLFTDAEVMEIRNRYTRGELKSALCEEFDVGINTIGRIVRGDVYRHLPVIPYLEVTIVCEYCGKTFTWKRKSDGGRRPRHCPDSRKPGNRYCAHERVLRNFRKATLHRKYRKEQEKAAEYLASTKQCRCCKKRKKLDDFSVNRAKSDGKHYYCRKCSTKKSKQHQALSDAERKRRRKGPYRKERMSEESV